jgi:colanic acid biosynthesis glycosyl transferase WcaI
MGFIGEIQQCMPARDGRINNVNTFMKILIYGINYSPELTGIGKYTGEMAEWLAANGHKVTVITAFPYYPEWAIHEKYKGKMWFQETINGVKVIRCPLYVPAQVTSVKRIIHEFSFLLGVFPVWFASLFRSKADLVFSIAPPFHLGLLPLLYAKIRKVAFISHIQDLQVDAAKDLGMIKSKAFLNIMFAIERFILRKSTRVSSISEGMKKKILAKNVDPAKFLMFPNWVDEEVIKPLGKEESLRNEFGLSMNDKVILYSGNLGEKQGLEIIINVAQSFADNEEVKFVICGSGGAKEKLTKLADDAQLKNVLFFPLQPYEKLSNLLAIADLHLVLQKASASDLVMPSKLTGILAAGGCPIVTAMPGTSLFEVIHDHNLGILVEPESESGLIAAIAKALSQDLNVYKENARAYTLKYLSKEGILSDFDSEIKRLI